MIPTDALIAYIAIIETGSFSAAADRLGHTPSGVSRTLSRLEQQLGTQLITRTTRRLDLTEEGRWFLAKVREILACLTEAEVHLQQAASQPSGLLRVNASSPALNHLIAPLLAGFIAQYPFIRLELIGAEAVVDLIEERADVAIRVGPLADSTLNARLLGESRLRLVAAPGYLAQHGLPTTSADLARHTLLGFNRPVSLNLWPLMHQAQAGMSIEPALTASSGETLRHLALSAVGIACLSDFLVGEDLRSGRLVSLLEPEILPWKQAIWAVFYKQGTLAPRIACFVDYMAQALQTTLRSDAIQRPD